MKRAICLCASKSRKGNSQRIDNLIRHRLNKVFDVFEFVKIGDINKTIDNLSILINGYDYLIICGGDGTFNHIVNAIARIDKKPILGYINTGTICDCGYSFGVNGSINKALKIIENQYTGRFDLIKIGDKYFTYMGAIGAFSSISYQTSRIALRIIGRLAYYLKALKFVFKKNKVTYSLTINGINYDGTSPFILLLNGNRVGGFKINKNSSSQDGYFEVYLTKNGIFNGLLSYFVFPKIKPIKTNKVIINSLSSSAWCLDGEQYELSSNVIEIDKNKLEVLCKKPFSK